MLANLFRRSAEYPISSLENPHTPIYQGLAGLDGDYAGFGGARVTALSSLRLVAVWRCVTLIAQTIASLPLGVYRREERGRTELRLPADAYLWQRPNPEMTRQTFWEAAIGTCVLTGNAYIYLARNGLGRITELWPLDPRRVAPYRTDRGEKRYRIDGEDASPRDILHVPGYGDGFKGLSPIGQAREALGMAMTAEQYGAQFFAQGSTLSGVLTTDQELNDAQLKRMDTSWRAAHSGPRNAYKTAILGGGVKWTSVSVPPADAQFLETRKFQTEEIARLFGVPPHMIGAVDKTTSWGTGIEQQTIGFVTYTLRPWITRFEQAATDELLAPENRYAQWNVNGLLRGDTAQRASWYQTARNIGVLSPNEIRLLEDEQPYPGGDRYDMPLNSASSGKDAAATETAPGDAPAPAGG